MKQIARIWLFACLILVSVQGKSALAGELVVAVATNFLTTARQISTDFEQETQHSVTLVAGSSGKLATQILAGAPFDVFLSADQARPKLLIEKGAAIADSRFTYATGVLVLWAREKLPVEGGDIQTFDPAGIDRVAMANPRLAPYGLAAQQVLDRLGVAGKLQGRVVQGENMGQTFAMTVSGNVSAGFLAKSQLQMIGDDVGGRWIEVPQVLHDPIRQEVVITKHGAANEAAKAFADYLQSASARATILQFGYMAGAQ